MFSAGAGDPLRVPSGRASHGRRGHRHGHGGAVPRWARRSWRSLPDGAHIGPAGDRTAFILVFALAIAVTSIPVISRIMFDLGILETAFARIVLAVAVHRGRRHLRAAGDRARSRRRLVRPAVGLPGLLGLDPGSRGSIGFHVAAHARVPRRFAVARPAALPRRAAVPLQRRQARKRDRLPDRVHADGHHARRGARRGAAVRGVRRRHRRRALPKAPTAPSSPRDDPHFSFAFFIPVYFAIVGLRLDLLRGFEPLFFLLSSRSRACAAKFVSVWIGARWPGDRPRGSQPRRGPERPRWPRHRARVGRVRRRHRRRGLLRGAGHARDRDVALGGSWLGRVVRAGSRCADLGGAPSVRVSPIRGARKAGARSGAGAATSAW